MKERLIYLAIIVILSVLLALSWGKSPKIRTITNTTTDTVYQNIQIRDTIYKPVPKVVVKTNVILDTIYVLEDYSKERIYRDTLRSKDDASYVYLYEKVRMNHIAERYYNFYNSNINIRTTETKFVYKERPHFYLGVDATTSGGIYLGGLYKTPNKGAYSFGYNPFDKSFILGVKFKLF